MTRIALAILLTMSAPAFALDPALDVSQYAHTAWKLRDGFTKGIIRDIAQTPDGYLWLGTEFGVLRFDGVRNVAWRPPAGQSLPSNDIWSLLVGRDGALWIGTANGLARWKDGTLTIYPELSGRIVLKLLEDREGTVWASGTAVPAGLLCAVRGDNVRCDGEDGEFGYGVFGLYEDRKGNLWAGSTGRLWRWKPGPPTLFPMPGEDNGIQGFDEDRDGTLLIATRDGLRRFVNGRTEPYPLSGPGQSLSASHLLHDRDGGLWMRNLRQGLLHVHQGTTDVFSQADGLSGDDIYAIFQDREGSVWVSTAGGLDRFRAYAVPTLSGKQGLTNGPVTSVLASTDGGLWVGTLDGLKRWNQGQFRAVGGGRLGRRIVASLFADSRGRIWVSGRDGVGYLEDGRFIAVTTGLSARSMAEDTQANLWIIDQERGLLQVSAGTDVKRIPWTELGHKDFATALIAERLRGGLWLGFWDGGVVYFKDGQVQAAYTRRDGLGAGRIGGFHADPDGTLWVATDGGLSRLKDGRVATLTSSSGLPCDSVHWVMEDDAHAFWLFLACGLARVARADVDAWAADSTRTVAATMFDSSDGVRTQALPGSHSPQVAKSRDGKLWFAVGDGVSVIDPGHLPFNALPPPVHVEQVVADRRAYDLATRTGENLRLPPLTRDLQIDYTALSLVAPEKMRFRYKLEGHDTDWQDVGTRRQAFYTDLPPGNYRFRVTASNNSGVWNETGASVDFAVAPAYYQAAWFRVLVAGLFIALLVASYRLRVRQVARQYNARVEARVSERLRIARDLHDTLLQSFQGLLLKFHALSYKLGPHPEVRQEFEAVIEQARQAIIEGRDAVQGLRASTLPGNDLARAIITFGEELAAARGDQGGAELHVQVEGASRDLASLVHDDVYRIACEAVRNACKHAGARRIEVEIHYDERQLRLRIRDDGKGIDRDVLREGARAGHYGLPGMHERARAIGGKLTVWSEVNSGTEIELTIPAGIAYAKASAALVPEET